MKGGYIHEHLLLDGLERAFKKRGAKVRRQVSTRPGRKTGYADLLIDLESGRLVIEAEMSSKRIDNDLKKARDLEAIWLWIVVPNQKVAHSVRKQLEELGVRAIEPWICVLTLGQALERVTNCFSLFSRPKLKGKTNTVSDGDAVSRNELGKGA